MKRLIPGTGHVKQCTFATTLPRTSECGGPSLDPGPTTHLSMYGRRTSNRALVHAVTMDSIHDPSLFPPMLITISKVTISTQPDPLLVDVRKSCTGCKRGTLNDLIENVRAALR